MYLKPEEQFKLIYDDCTYDSKQGSIVDFAFATGLSFLNLKGIARPERSIILDRLQEILEELRRMHADSLESAAPTSERAPTAFSA